MKFYQKFQFFLLILLLSNHQISHAKWLTREDAQVEYEFYNEDIQINKDATNESTIEFSQKLLKEGAKAYLSKYELAYSEDATRMKILEAKTIHQNIDYFVDKQLIEDKPLASEMQGFDQTRQISIPFEKVEVGSKIYLKLLQITKKIPIKDHYSEVIELGTSGYWKNARITLTSKIPLYISINDPYEVLKVSNKKKGDLQIIEIKLIKPLINSTINDIDDGILNEKFKTWVSISSDKVWSKIATTLAKKYDTVIEQNLPKKFQEIAELAAKETSDVDKINKVTSLLQDNLQYLGDWKTIEGGVIPRDLDVIAKTQYGDCKDFSVATAGILRKIGFKANAALVKRGEIIEDYRNKLPSVNAFDHAITYIKNNIGEEYWIDPTNDISMANGIFPDITDRMSLVLDKRNILYKRIPKIASDKALSTVETKLKINHDTIDKSIKLCVSKEKAIEWTASNLYLSKETVEDMFYESMQGMTVEKKKRVKSIIPDLKSRIVRDLIFNIDYQVTTPYTKTNFGKSIYLTSIDVPDFIRSAPYDSVNDLYIGIPSTMKRIITINQAIENIKDLDFNIQSPWINVSRICKINNHQTIITQKVEILKSYITYAERKKSLYKNLQQNLEEHFMKVSIVLPQQRDSL